MSEQTQPGQPEQKHGSGKGDFAIEIDDLTLTYSDGTRAVRGISMGVSRGEFFGFLGPNGAGKTTTIKVLATLLEPTGGNVSVNGFDVVEEAQKVRETIGYMAQETSVDRELTARENIRFACEAYGIPRKERRERIDELLELVGLSGVADKKAEEFSGGMKKRLDASMALVHQPPLVFLDEPTTGLDPKARNELWEYFKRINNRGITIFLTTQYLDEADYLCEKLAVIRDGKVVANGSPSELKRRVGGDLLDIEIDGGRERRERAVEVLRNAGVLDGDASIEVTDWGVSIASGEARSSGTSILVTLDNAGIQVTGFDIREPTLDDVFLAITNDDEATYDTDTDPRSERGER